MPDSRARRQPPRAISRRELLRTGARPARRLVFAPAGGPAGDTLVVIFLRGGMDALHTVPPCGEPAYYRQRPTLAVPGPGPSGAAVDLDGRFALHPTLSPLRELYRAGHLAVVHACGSPDTTLSHFEAMQTMERGVSDGGTTASGWLTRHLRSSAPRSESPLRALAFGSVLPKSLQGTPGATAVRSLTEFRLQAPAEWGPGFRAGLAALYSEGEDAAATAGRAALRLLTRLEQLDPARYRPTGGAAYPAGEFGDALRQTAQLIKADLGLEAACVDLGGWDSHVAQPTLLDGLMRQLAAGLHAFHTDLADHLRRVTVVAMSEFGRRVHENSGLGTDHGRGTAMLLLGGAVRGGRVYGRWPGVAPDELDRDGNLQVTTDYRDVLAEVVRARLRNPHLAEVFPGHAPRPIGLVSG